MKAIQKIKTRKERYLKVYPKYFQRSYHKAAIFPEIRLCGKWLKQLGFEHGAMVIVSLEKNKLTITLSEDDGHS